VDDAAITEVERAAAAHWRGTEERRLGGWILRAAGGVTGRANSALPLGSPGLPLDDALAEVVAWYRARGLPPMIAVPMPLTGSCGLDGELSARAWSLRPGPVFVMTADLARLPGPAGLPDGLELRADGRPDEKWLRLHGYPVGPGGPGLPPARMKLLMSAEEQAFVSIRPAGGGEAVAVARLSYGGGWAGITSVAVAPGRRRSGLGTAITLGCCALARAAGAGRVFLQVETGNDAAIRMYERCGLRRSHRYHYRIAPPRVPSGVPG
jgi:GNAT superfamily N-acetyltransferase